MSSIVVSGDTSGSVTLQAPTISSTTTLTLPVQPGLTATMLSHGGTYYVLQTAVTGANATGAQSIFGLTNGITVAASTIYEFELNLVFTKTAGTTSHTISSIFAGTATLNNISYTAVLQATGTGAAGNTGTAIASTVATATVLTGAYVTAAPTIPLVIKGIVSVNASGTFLPQYSLSAAPGGAYTTAIGSYIKMVPLAASGSNVNIGSWS